MLQLNPKTKPGPPVVSGLLGKPADQLNTIRLDELTLVVQIVQKLRKIKQGGLDVLIKGTEDARKENKPASFF